jgi:hypothetical protein
MKSTSGVRVEVDTSRREIGTFDRVIYARVEPGASTATINGKIDARLEWKLGSLVSMWVDEKDEWLVGQMLDLKRCELLPSPADKTD